MSRFTLPAALACALLLAAPSGASADTFCVHAPAGCVGTAKPTIQDALDATAAAPGFDTVRVGRQSNAQESLNIVAGNVVDVLGDNGATITLDATHTVTIAEPDAVFDLDLSATVAPASGPLVDLQAGTLRDMVISARAGDPVVRLGDATLDHVTVGGMAEMHEGAAVLAVGPGGVIKNQSEIWGPIGIVSTSDDLVMSHSFFFSLEHADATGVRVEDGKTTIQQSYIQLRAAGPSGVGIDVAPGVTGAIELALDGVTVRGGAPLSAGLRADCTGGGTASIALTDTALFGFGTDIDRYGPACATALTYSRYGTRDGHSVPFADGVGVTAGPPTPFSPAFWPTYGSALIDAGTPGPAADPDEGDVMGSPSRRVVDGDGDGVGRRDIGAGEYARMPPLAILNNPDTAKVGVAVEFDASHSWDSDQEPFTRAWTVDGQAVTAAGDGAKLSVTFTTAGPHTVELRMKDPAGLSSTYSRTVTVTGEPEKEKGNGTVPSVEPPKASPPPLPVLKAASVTATLLGKKLSAGALKVKVACAAGGHLCKGSVVLKAGKVRLGTAKFSVAAGKAATVRVKVTGKAAKRALAKKGGAKVTVGVLRADGKPWKGAKVGR